MLSVADVTFAYGARVVLAGVSIHVADGEVVGVLGPNGSGKTTLLHTMVGLRRPAAGEVCLDGTPLGALARRSLARRVALVPQSTEVVFDYTVLELVLMGRFAHLPPFAFDGPEDEAVARAALVATDAGGLADRLFHTLSGGEKQRVAIAGALAQLDLPSPHDAADGALGRYLLLDEPTTALDLRHRLDLLDLLATLNRRHQVTLVIATHDLDYAASVCDRLVFLREGRVVASGTPPSVLTSATIRAVYDVDAVIEPGGTVRVVRPPSSGARALRRPLTVHSA